MGASARRTTGTAAARSPRAARAGTCGERGALAFGDLWRSAVKGAGLPDGTRFRDLRHFYASALIDANLKPKVIQARLGHATIAETMDTYGHLFPGSEDLGRGAVDDALAGALAEQEQERPVSAQALARARACALTGRSCSCSARAPARASSTAPRPRSSEPGNRCP